MTNQEIAHALEKMILEDAKRPPDEQIRELIEAGVIDEQGRVLIGGSNKTGPDQLMATRNGLGSVPHTKRVAKT